MPPATENRFGASHLGHAAVIAGFLLFSSSPALVAGAELEGLALASWRAVVSAIAFGAFTWLRGGASRDVLTKAALSGLSFGLAVGMFFEAAQRTSVANTAIIAAMQPVPMLFAARIVFREKVTHTDIGWFVIALVGAVVMVLSADTGGTASLEGDTIAAVSTLFGAAYFIFSRQAREHLDAVPLMAGVMAWSAVVLVPLALLYGQDLAPPAGDELVRLAAIALIPGLGHVFIAYSQQSVSLVVIGLAQLLMPVGAATLAWLFLDQDITRGQLLGILLVLAALAAHTIHRSRMEAAATEAT